MGRNNGFNEQCSLFLTMVNLRTMQAEIAREGSHCAADRAMIQELELRCRSSHNSGNDSMVQKIRINIPPTNWRTYTYLNCH